MLKHKMPQETRDNALLQRRMQAGKQLGADTMTKNSVKELTTETQLLVEPEPINIASWDATICAELGGER